MQTARALLKLASTTPDMLGQEDYELRKAEPEAVSNDLTRAGARILAPTRT